MNFADAIHNEGTKTYTENGATAINTTGSAVLDLFGTIGSLREAKDQRLFTLFAEAYKEDALLATRCLFYARDIRGGLGERSTFRRLLNYVAAHHPEAIRNNISIIPEYGRWDDLYSLAHTPLEKEMWKVIKAQLEADIANKKNGNPISLLAKWLKRPDGRKPNRGLGLLTAAKLGYKPQEYKHILSDLRAYLKVTEISMSANQWSAIDYAAVPSRASMNYRNAFLRHDEERYRGFLDAVTRGETKINASTLYPYDILAKYDDSAGGYSMYFHNIKQDDLLEAQWKALPDYVGKEANALVIADTSGSMTVSNARPLYSALGLAIYFAERNKGAYHNLWMTFSQSPQIQVLKGETLAQKLQNMNMNNWSMNTNLEKAFMKVLDIAIDNHVPSEEMVKSLIVISDMEIDECVSKKWLFYDEMASRFKEHGYEIPNVVFWNVNSRHDIFHADKNRKGVQLCSGQSPSTFKTLMSSVGMTPIEMMVKTLNDERYQAIVIA